MPSNPDQIRNFNEQLKEVKDPDTLVTMGRQFLTQAKQAGIPKDRMNNLINETYGGSPSGSSTPSNR